MMGGNVKVCWTRRSRNSGSWTNPPREEVTRPELKKMPLRFRKSRSAVLITVRGLEKRPADGRFLYAARRAARTSFLVPPRFSQGWPEGLIAGLLRTETFSLC